MGCMRILDDSGHSVVEWNQEDIESVAYARYIFDVMREKGQLAFATPPGSSAEEAILVRVFDPDDEVVTWVRPITGG